MHHYYTAFLWQVVKCKANMLLKHQYIVLILILTLYINVLIPHWHYILQFTIDNAV
jgi:hypothetical protein